LDKTLQEEKKTDEALTSLAEAAVKPPAPISSGDQRRS
jgi:ferritin-like metal-binding protein YciE